MPARTHTSSIDRLSAAEGVLALLGKLRSERLPPDERMAIATVQIEAVDEWFAAFMDASFAQRAP